ncbi:RNA-binding domain-containing protein [Bifidobacterium sp. UTBIF-78]|uniref:RNA-binding domain-containing protein n=1 Tax=Bifidobacterium sp. UTBIF-78 TaxID=1465263 RepID=UPI001128886C|nr:RNA-binding domain-containing protein [Bifidobacterium sp. UTBIF-78]
MEEAALGGATMEREGQRLEFKRDWNDSAKKTVVAFANSDGGRIVIGVDDDGTPAGVGDVDECMLRAMQAISSGISPDLARFVDIRSGERSGMPVVIVDVKPGTDRPYYLRDRGPRPSGVYIRLGAGSIPASEPAILEMLRGTSRVPFERAASVDQSLTFDAAGGAFDEAGIPFGDGERRSLGLVDSDGLYTNLAWLLSDQCTASIKAAVFEGTDKLTFTSREEFSGSLFSQFQGVAEYVNRFNSTRSTFDGSLRRHDRRDYSPAVVREALLNLVVHRDYSLTGPALVSVFDDRMELVNFGGLPRGMTRGDMMLGVSLQRNPGLAAILYRLRWVEAYGTGIPKILDDYRDAPVRPGFEVSDNAFKLTLPSHNPSARPRDGRPAAPAEEPASTPLSNRRMALGLAARPEGVSRAELQDRTGLARSGAGKLLSSLTAEGVVEKRGTGRATRYHARPVQ